MSKLLKETYVSTSQIEDKQAVMKIQNKYLTTATVHPGHITKAEYTAKPFVFGQKDNNPGLLIEKGYYYVAALNKKAAIKKFLKGNPGFKQLSINPLKLKK